MEALRGQSGHLSRVNNIIIVQISSIILLFSCSVATVRTLEKARNSGQLSIDATSALLTTSDNLLSSSPPGDGLLDGTLKQDGHPSSPLNNNAEMPSDDEFSGRAKRRKRDV